MTRSLAEQEFVAHLFAPVEGPLAGAAAAQLQAIRRGCQIELGMTRPIPGTDDMPADWADLPDGSAAGLEAPSTGYQVVARRVHDVLNLSVALLAPRPDGLASAVASGWPEFTRWWDQVALGGGTALLGETLVYLAKADGPAGADARAALPPRPGDGER